MKNLRYKIESTLSLYPCRYSVIIKNLADGGKLELCPDTVFPAASMIKVPIMYEIMRQAASGKRSLDEMLMISDDVRVDGAGVLNELRPNLPLTVRELVTLMIVISDNTATNRLIDWIGMDAVNRTMSDLGLRSTVLKRRMMDFTAARAGNENLTCAADLERLFSFIADSRDLSPEYSRLMLDILSRQQVQDKLPFYWPEEIRLAHKTGTLPGVEHDAGILYLPGGPYFLCVMLGNLAANYQGLRLGAELGKVIYEHLTHSAL